MNYSEAMAALRKVPSALTKKHGVIYGARTRHKLMGKGWSVFYIAKGFARGFYCLNPVTGSNYAFTPHERDKSSTTWVLV